MNRNSASAEKSKGGRFEKQRADGLSLTEKITTAVAALALLGCLVIGVCILLDRCQGPETALNSTSTSEALLRTEPVTTQPVTEAAPTQTVAVTDTEPADTEPPATEPADTEPADTEPADTEPPATEPVEEELPTHNDGLTDADRAALKEELEALFDMDTPREDRYQQAWWFCQALSSFYASPEQVDLSELFYLGTAFYGSNSGAVGEHYDEYGNYLTTYIFCMTAESATERCS